MSRPPELVPHDAIVLGWRYQPEQAGGFAQLQISFRPFIGDRKEWVYGDPDSITVYGEAAKAGVRQMIKADRPPARAHNPDR